jgi:thioredoxin
MEMEQEREADEADVKDVKKGEGPLICPSANPCDISTAGIFGETMASQDILILDSNSFEQELAKKGDGPILVDFWAEWCGPCRLMGPILDKVAARYKGRARVGKVDVDENQALAAKFGVMSIPTIFLFKEGQIVEQVVGTTSEDNLAKMIERHSS